MVKIDIIGKSNTLSKKEISKLIQDIFLKLDKVLESTIEIKFVSQREMKKLNFKYRKTDTPTDVMSFPQTIIPGKEQILGTIVICEKYSKKVDGTTEELIKHGVLHLLGFDHETNRDEWAKVAKIISHIML